MNRKLTSDYYKNESHHMAHRVCLNFKHLQWIVAEKNETEFFDRQRDRHSKPASSSELGYNYIINKVIFIPTWRQYFLVPVTCITNSLTWYFVHLSLPCSHFSLSWRMDLSKSPFHESSFLWIVLLVTVIPHLAHMSMS